MRSNTGPPTCVPPVRAPTLPAMFAHGSAVLAHQGGWDELIFVLLPIGLFAGLLAIANRRATRAQAERDGEPVDPD